jgi:S-adenosylmethionine synthetase
LSSQSPDIALGVNASFERRNKSDFSDFSESDKFGAGDQGLMFGFACDETEEFMPAPIYFAHKLARRLSQIRREKILDYLRPDGKTQVTVEYENGKAARIENIVVSTQHAPDALPEQIEADVKKRVIEDLDEIKGLIDDNTKYYINPTGRFVFGGPAADSGLTGRKIIVDTYGGYASHGGGCFSGKDPTKVDRTGAYMARYIAKNLVAQDFCKKSEIEIAYAIGVAHPLSIWASTLGTGKISDEKLAAYIKEKYDCRPAAIIERFNLTRPIYRQTATYGHFGRSDLDLPWEKVEK